MADRHPRPTQGRHATPVGRRLGAGGEAEVFEVAGQPGLAVKLYRHPDPLRSAKLRLMVDNPPDEARPAGGHVAIAWPTAVVTDGGDAAGFVMPRVDLTRAVPLFQVYNPQARRAVAPDFSWRYLLRTARNVAAIVASLHEAGYVIGDLNESNFLVTDRALVVLVDCDSMQVRDQQDGIVYRGAVGKPEFLAPEFHGLDLARTDRTAESDAFALAVLIFLLLMEGQHPFAGVWRGSGDPPDLSARVRRGAFAYRPLSRTRPAPHALPLTVLPPPLRGLVWRAFTSGLRRPARRPSPREWVVALERAEAVLRTCRRSRYHVFGRWLLRCPWCARVDRGLPDPFPGPTGTGVGPRRRVGAARRVRLAWRRYSSPRGRKLRPRPVLGVIALLAALAWSPAAFLVATMVAAPAAFGVLAPLHGGRSSRAWGSTWARVGQGARAAVASVRGAGWAACAGLLTAAATWGAGASWSLASRASVVVALAVHVRAGGLPTPLVPRTGKSSPKP